MACRYSSSTSSLPNWQTASRFAEHPCGGAARPAKASLAPKPNARLAASVEDPRSDFEAYRSEAEGAPASC